jgi:hypothetical protein
VGEKAATTRKIPKTQTRQGLRIVVPRRKPMRLKVDKKIGSAKARPTRRIRSRKKS